MSMQDDVINDMKRQLTEAQGGLKSHLAKLRTGRASLSMLDDVRVIYYGTPTPLSQCATLTIADPRLIVIKPFEKGLIKEIEKGLRDSGLGLTPQNDGDIVRLPIPGLTEERRRDLVKKSKQLGEEMRIVMRNHRRDANEMLKDLEKEKEISQDDLKRALEKVQTELDAGIAKIDEMLAQKEKEILEI